MGRKTSIGGIILVVLGFLLLMSRFEIHLFQFILPVALIILGIWFIYRKRNGATPLPPPPGQYHQTPEGTFTYTPPPPPPGGPVPPPPPPGESTVPPTSGTSGPAGPRPGTFDSHHLPSYPQVEGGKVKYSKFIGDMYIDCRNINLQNVEISMFIGDTQVNLSGGKLSPGLNRMIISGFLGDILVLVPRDFPVFVHCSGFVGDVDLFGRRTSGFGNTLDASSPNYDSADSKLYIATNNFIGDVRVYVV